jgi:hypothetical protein
MILLISSIYNRWVGGFEKAILQMGYSFGNPPQGAINGAFTSGDGSMGLRILTGLPSHFVLSTDIPGPGVAADTMWDLFVEHADSSPVVIGSYASVKALPSPEHVYTVMSTYTDGASVKW